MTADAAEPTDEARSAAENRLLPLEAVTAFAHELHDQLGIDPDRVPLDRAATLTDAVLARHLPDLVVDGGLHSACLPAVPDLPEDRRRSRDVSVMQRQDALRKVFSGHEDGEQLADLAWDTVRAGYLGMWDTCEHLKNAYDSMRAEVERLDAEVVALRAGEDDTPVPEGAVGTPEQWLYRLNRMTGDKRQQWMHEVHGWHETAGRCTGTFTFTRFGHAQQIANLTTERDWARDEVRDLLYRPTQHAFEAACEALERRRVALVTALQQPADMAFDDAVEVAGRFADMPAQDAPAGGS